MAKPRIFLSSTCYDLGDARAALTEFLEGYGFEVLNSQTAKFGVKPKVHSHDACLEMIPHADYVVLIVGGRRGGTYVHSDKSITNEEIRVARKLDRPILAFVDRKVDALRQTYRKNPGAVFTPTVEDPRIFDFLDAIASSEEDNWLHPFDTVNDIKTGLQAQFAYFLLLYSHGLRPAKGPAVVKAGQPVAFPKDLPGVPGDSEEERTDMIAGLRQVYDTLKRIKDSDLNDGAKGQQFKTIWVMGRHGQSSGNMLRLKEDRFKGSAWGGSKGQRVFNQMEDCGVTGGYDVDDDNEGRQFGVVYLVFDAAETDGYPADALKTWVEALLARYGEDAEDMFDRLDMKVFETARPKPAVKTGRKTLRRA
ncbi:hypothetical protein LTR94_025247 [Friedmanniomyces endolithicus]|nr:hypothetical protein LTR94_025247 [Friedmanniomyces endolithicus]